MSSLSKYFDVTEAPLRMTEAGLIAAETGWFVVNVRDALWTRRPGFGARCTFGEPESGFSQLGINIRVLRPGEPNGLYHRDSHQEDFLVLSGACVVLVEGEERELQAWDFVHCPPNTEHIFVGSGEGPCVILMAGSRSGEDRLVYPISTLAQKYGASAKTTTTSSAVAYRGLQPHERARPKNWHQLPWG